MIFHIIINQADPFIGAAMGLDTALPVEMISLRIFLSREELVLSKMNFRNVSQLSVIRYPIMNRAPSRVISAEQLLAFHLLPTHDS